MTRTTPNTGKRIYQCQSKKCRKDAVCESRRGIDGIRIMFCRRCANQFANLTNYHADNLPIDDLIYHDVPLHIRTNYGIQRIRDDGEWMESGLQTPTIPY